MCSLTLSPSRFFFNDPATTEIYTLSLHDALPISVAVRRRAGLREHVRPRHGRWAGRRTGHLVFPRSEEHTSELQSQSNLVCRLLLEKKKNLRPIRRQVALYPFLHFHQQLWRRERL